jgi:hypothetical protein
MSFATSHGTEGIIRLAMERASFPACPGTDMTGSAYLQVTISGVVPHKNPPPSVSQNGK